MDAGPAAVLVVVGGVALIAVVAILITTLRRFLLARAQTRRAMALLDANSEQWTFVTSAAGHENAGRPCGEQGRPASKPWWRAGSSPRHALPATALHGKRAS